MSDPRLLSRQLVLKALADPAFFKRMPEFSGLQPKLRTMGIDMNRRGGCKGCRQRRVEQNVFRDFMTVLGSLSPDALVRLKQYLCTDQLMTTLRNKETGAFETKTL